MRLKVTAEELNERLDRVVPARTGITRSQVQMLIQQTRIRVNDKAVKVRYKLKDGDVITVERPEQESEALVAEPIALDILFSDAHLVVLNKPPALVVHPAAGNRTGTLMNGLLQHFKRLARIGGPLRPGVVHRLDKDTSGAIVVALTDEAYYGLIEQFSARLVRKQYLALIYGTLKQDSGQITSGIGRSTGDRKKMSTQSRRPKPASTSWTVLKRFPGATLIEVRIETGRTHQIRVHLASIGHSVLGDRTYGKKLSLRRGSKIITFPRQMLHAQLIGFTHPVTGEQMTFEAPLPDDMSDIIKTLSIYSK